MRWPMCVLAAVVGLAPGVLADDRPVLVRDLTDNVRVVLTGARLSETRGRYLIARFQTVGKEPKVIVISFPGHSFTTHEQTLRAVIRSCVDMTKRDDDGWARAEAEAIFSVPPDGGRSETGRYSRLEKVYLLSVGPRKGE